MADGKLTEVDFLVKGLKDLLGGLEQFESGSKQAKEAGDALTQTSSRLYRSTSELVGAFGHLGKFMTQEAKTLDSVTAGLNKMSDAIDSSIGLSLLGNIPVVGMAVNAFKQLKTAAVKAAEGYVILVKDIDSLSAPLRQFQSQAFGIGKAFAMSFEESDKFAQGIVSLAVKNENLKDTFISYPEMLRNAESFANLGLSIGHMSENVDLGQRNLNLLATATLLAGASGEEVSTTMTFLTKSIMEQGISTQQAVEQYGLFADSAEKTGLSLAEVKSGLDSSVNAYTRMGMAAEFAKPALDTFAASLTKTGLGIKNAKGLAQELTKTFANMANSYDKAFITMSRGGMNFSGGVFGASIEMQARMMDAEKTGDQSAMAREMISAMKGTLQSFTGDDIVTVQEARESPELQKTFVMQQKILQDMYGMGQTEATRTLEMLQELEGAAAAGDEVAAEKLEKMIEEEVKGRNETKDIQERIAKNTQNNVMATLLLNNNFRGMAKASRMVSSELGRGAENVMEGGGDMAISLLDSGGDMIKKMAMNSLKMDEETFDKSGLDPFEVVTGAAIDSTKETVGNLIDGTKDFGKGVISAGTKFAEQVKAAGDELFGKLSKAGIGYQNNPANFSGNASAGTVVYPRNITSGSQNGNQGGSS